MQKQVHKRRVVVVGGGVVGCATAFECAQAGYDVTLVERDAIAAHASGKNAGNLNPLIGTPAGQIGFALDAFQRHAEVYTALNALGCAEYEKTPVKRVHLGYDEADRPHLEEIAAASQADERFSARWLDRATLRTMEPRLAPDVGFGVLTEGSLSVSSRDFTHALARGAVRLGAKIVIGAVTGIVTRNEQAVTVGTSEGPIACDALVLATGPWIAETKAWLGVSIPVSPVKGQMLRMCLAGDVPAYDLTWQSISLYKRQYNELWVGVTMEHSGFETSTTAEAKTLLLNQAARILPAIEQAELIEHTAALRPMPVSGECIAGRAPGWQNVYVANGGGAKGVLLSTGIARKLRLLLQHDSSAQAYA